MSVSQDFLDYVIEQLGAVARLTSRRMFGGIGLYADGLFFALIDDDTLYLKVDDSNRADYVQRGSQPFCPFPDKGEFSMSYYDAPADLLEDAEELSRWARKSVAIALIAASKKTLKSAKQTKTKVAKRAKYQSCATAPRSAKKTANEKQASPARKPK